MRILCCCSVICWHCLCCGRSFGSADIWVDRTYILAAMGLLASLSSLTLFESFRYMDAGIASTMLFVYPVMVAAIMALRYGERISPLSVLCLAASVGGIVLLCRSGDGLPLSLHGTLLVMVSALAYALYIVGVNKSRVGAIPPQKMTFYVLSFGLLLFAVRSFAGGGVVMPHGAAMWGNLLGLALFPTTLSFVCISRAIRCIGSSRAGCVGASDGDRGRHIRLRREHDAAHSLRHNADPCRRYGTGRPRCDLGLPLAAAWPSDACLLARACRVSLLPPQALRMLLPAARFVRSAGCNLFFYAYSAGSASR